MKLKTSLIFTLALFFLAACGDDPQIKAFKSEDRQFDMKVDPGTDGGRNDDIQWEALCGGDANKVRGAAMSDLISSFALRFKKESNDVELEFECINLGSLDGKKTFNLKYTIQAPADGALKVVLDLNGLSIMGKTLASDTTLNKNLLEFASKTSWFYFPKEKAIKGVLPLFELGYTAPIRLSGAARKTKKIDSVKDLNEALEYIKTSSGEIAPDAPAHVFILKMK